MALVVNIEKEDDFKKKKINNLFKETITRLELYLEEVNQYTFTGIENEPVFIKVKDFITHKLPSYYKLYLDNKNLFDNEDFIDILLNDLEVLHDKVKLLDSNIYTHDKLIQLQNPVQNFIESFRAIEIAIISLKNTSKLITQLKNQVKKATISVENIESAKLALEANETDKIYKNLSDKYEDEYEINNESFKNSLIATVFCTILSVIYTFNTPLGEINWPVFISVKLLIVAVGITLCTLFLRRSAHAKKLYEKAYQTHVEINAYPIFIKSLETKDQQEITKELALRYFGKEIDQTQNDKIGDLVQNQLSAGTELIKASAEMVKAKQSESKGKEE